MLIKPFPCVHITDLKNQQKNNDQSEDVYGLGEVIGMFINPNAITKSLDTVCVIQWENIKNPATTNHKASDIVNLTSFDFIANNHNLVQATTKQLEYNENPEDSETLELKDEEGNIFTLSQDCLDSIISEYTVLNDEEGITEEEMQEECDNSDEIEEENTEMFQEKVETLGEDDFKNMNDEGVSEGNKNISQTELTCVTFGCRKDALPNKLCEYHNFRSEQMEHLSGDELKEFVKEYPVNEKIHDDNHDYGLDASAIDNQN